MMHVVFYDRDFAIRPKSLLVDGWSVDRYSIHVIGGPETMSASAPATVDKWEMMNFLRCPVEVYDEDMTPLWWGYVNKVSIPHGKSMLSLSLDDMANSVVVSYSTIATTDAQSEQKQTAAATNAMSIAEFGTKEKIVTINEATATSAAQKRDTYLALHGAPIQETEVGAGGSRVMIECKGWWSSLSWRYYTSTSTALVDTISLVGSAIASVGEFIADVFATEASGVNVSGYRNPYDGQRTAQGDIETLLAVGNTSGKRMLATVTKNRVVVINSEPAESVQYFISQTGGLESITGQPIPPTRCIVGAWARIKDAPAVIGAMTAVKNLFIDSAEWSGGKITYRFAGERNLLNINEVR